MVLELRLHHVAVVLVALLLLVGAFVAGRQSASGPSPAERRQSESEDRRAQERLTEAQERQAEAAEREARAAERQACELSNADGGIQLPCAVMYGPQP
jgi:hypothetical protein